MTGSSSEQGDESEDSSSKDPEVALADCAAQFNLTKKDLARPDKAQVLQDLSTRQLAFCVSSLRGDLSSSDILELGGELETCLFSTTIACAYLR